MNNSIPEIKKVLDQDPEEGCKILEGLLYDFGRYMEVKCHGIKTSKLNLICNKLI